MRRLVAKAILRFSLSAEVSDRKCTDLGPINGVHAFFELERYLDRLIDTRPTTIAYKIRGAITLQAPLPDKFHLGTLCTSIDC